MLLCLFAAFGCTKRTSIHIDMANPLEIQAGQASLLKYSVEPPGTKITWTSSDESVAYLLENYLMASSAGTATITAMSSDGVQASFFVKVLPVPIKSFSMVSSLSLYYGETAELQTKDFEPKNADAGSVEWTVSDGKIAKVRVVDGKAMVEGVGAGTVTVTGTAGENHDIVKTCTVTVKGPDVLKIMGDEVIYTTGSEYAYEAVQQPEVYSDMSWSLSDNSVVSVVSQSREKIVLRPVSPGKVELSLAAGPKTAKLTVNVKDPEIRFTQRQDATMFMGDTFEAAAQLYPVNLTDGITWSTSDSGILSVTTRADGKATFSAGSRSGTATVTAKRGDFKSSFNVKVVGNDYKPCIAASKYSSYSSGNIIKVYSDGDRCWYMPMNFGHSNDYSVNVMNYTDYFVICGEDGKVLDADIAKNVTWSVSECEKYFETGSNASCAYCRMKNLYVSYKQTLTAHCPCGITRTLTIYFAPEKLAVARFNPDMVKVSGSSYNEVICPGAVSTSLGATGTYRVMGYAPYSGYSLALLPDGDSSTSPAYYRFIALCTRPDGKEAKAVICGGELSKITDTLPSGMSFTETWYYNMSDNAYLGSMPIVTIKKFTSSSATGHMHLKLSGSSSTGLTYDLYYQVSVVVE